MIFVTDTLTVYSLGCSQTKLSYEGVMLVAI